MSKQAEMLRPDREYYGQPHPDNGKPDNGGDAYYFVVDGDAAIGGRLSGYLTRKQFNWLAGRVGTPALSEKPLECSCGAFEMNDEVLHSAHCPEAK